MRVRQIQLAVVTLLMGSSWMFAGTVSGKVTYTGTPAKPRQVDMSEEPSCAQQHATPAVTENVVTGAGNALVNVVVYISAGADDEGQVPPQAVTYEQKGCQYLPHVVALHVNQELRIVNADPTSHNVHPLAKVNREWNKSQPQGSPPISERYGKAEFIPVKCNVHPWMKGWLAVLNTSHYDLSQGDGGFTLPNLPPGQYTLTAWHEVYGTQTAEVIITGGETKQVNFTFKTSAR